MNEAERDRLVAEMRTPEAWARLHDIEREIVNNLAERPVHTYCGGCIRMLRRLHSKAWPHPRPSKTT